MSSLNPGAASFNVNSQTLQFQMTLDPSSNPVIAGDVVTLLNSGNVRRADNGTVVPYTFDSVQESSGQYMSAAELSSTTFVVAYVGASGHTSAVIGTVSGNTITYGTHVVLNAVADGSDVNVCALSSTSFAVSFDDDSGDNVVVCTVSGSTITVGTPQIFYAGGTNFSGIAALSPTAFVIAYRVTGTSYAYAVVCSVSGTTVTFNTPAQLNSVSSAYISVSALSSTSFVVAYVASNFASAVVGTISGTTITAGTPAVLNAVTSNSTRVAALDATDFVVAYNSPSNTVSAVVCSISGTTITKGTPVSLLSTVSSGGFPTVCGISSSQFFVGARTSTAATPQQVQGILCSQSSNVITAGAQTTLVYERGSAANLALSATLLTTGQLVVAYAAAECRAISVPFSGNVITYPGIAVNNTIGVAASSATGGNNLNVVSIGVTATNISYTLTIGTQYYWDPVGGVPTTNSAYPYALGVALNTQLLLVARNTGTQNQYFG